MRHRNTEPCSLTARSPLDAGGSHTDADEWLHACYVLACKHAGAQRLHKMRLHVCVCVAPQRTRRTSSACRKSNFCSSSRPVSICRPWPRRMSTTPDASRAARV